MIAAKCRDCGATYKVKDESEGKLFRCRQCNATVRVPGAASSDHGTSSSASPRRRKKPARPKRPEPKYEDYDTEDYSSDYDYDYDYGQSDDYEDYAPRQPRRSKTGPAARRARPKKSRHLQKSGTSVLRGAGFGCLYMVLVNVIFAVFTAFAAPLVFRGPEWNHRGIGQVAGLIGIYIIGPVAAVVGFLRHRRRDQ